MYLLRRVDPLHGGVACGECCVDQPVRSTSYGYGRRLSGLLLSLCHRTPLTRTESAALSGRPSVAKCGSTPSLTASRSRQQDVASAALLCAAIELPASRRRSAIP